MTWSRRDFLKATAAASALSALGSRSAAAATPPSAERWV